MPIGRLSSLFCLAIEALSMMERCRREDFCVDADPKIDVVVLFSDGVFYAFELANDDLGPTDDDTMSSDGSAELVLQDFGFLEPRYLRVHQ